LYNTNIFRIFLSRKRKEHRLQLIDEWRHSRLEVVGLFSSEVWSWLPLECSRNSELSSSQFQVWFFFSSSQFQVLFFFFALSHLQSLYSKNSVRTFDLKFMRKSPTLFYDAILKLDKNWNLKHGRRTTLYQIDCEIHFEKYSNWGVVDH